MRLAAKSESRFHLPCLRRLGSLSETRQAGRIGSHSISTQTAAAAAVALSNTI